LSDGSSDISCSIVSTIKKESNGIETEIEIRKAEITDAGVCLQKSSFQPKDIGTIQKSIMMHGKMNCH